MSGSFINTVLPLAGTFFVAILGWWIAHWIANPILELEKARRETYALWRNYRHASNDWIEEKIIEVTDKFGAMAAHIDAIWVTSSGLIRWYCRQVRGWNLTEVQTALRSLSNVRGTTRDERTILWHELQKAFRFPLSDTPERIERIKKRMDRDQS